MDSSTFIQTPSAFVTSLTTSSVISSAISPSATSTLPAVPPPPYPYSQLVLNKTWDPPFAQMNFTRPENCPVCAEFLASLFRSAQTRDDHSLEQDWLPGIRATTRCFRGALPSGFAPVPTDTQLLELYFRLQFQDDGHPLEDNVTDPILDACRPDVCRALGWQGNSDLSGIGVLTSFIIEAVLAAMYTAALGAAELGYFKAWWPTAEPGRSKPMAVILDRLLGAFAATVPGFRSSAAFFCSAITLSALAVAIKAMVHPDETTNYEVVTAILVCNIALFPVGLLNALERRQRVPYLNRFITSVLGLLVTVQINVSMIVGLTTTLDSGDKSDPFMVHCPIPPRVPFQVFQATYCLYVVGGVAALVFRFKAKKWGWDKHSWAVKVKSRWKMLATVPCLVIEWAYLAVYYKLRADMLSRAGPTNRDNEWTFGQLVAVLTWAGVVIEFVYRTCFPHDVRGTLLNPPDTAGPHNATPAPVAGDEALVPLARCSTV